MKNKRSLNIATNVINDGVNKRLIIFVVTIVLIVFTILFLYGPTRELYVASRENAKLNAQYEAIKQTNEDLKKDIENLKTPEGIKQRAKDSLGLIQQGESTGVVVGTTQENKTESNATETSSRLAYKNVKAPETWFSPIGDFFFGYKN